MKKILEFGRKMMFYVRVLSGYEERRIRAMRLEMEKRIQQSEERKAAIRKIPEETILREVRRMVEGMQNLNKQLEEAEAAVDEYFKPLDKEVQRVMKTQLEGEEKTMKQMMMAMQEQAFHEQAQAVKKAKVHDADALTSSQGSDSEPPAPREANVR